MGKKHTNFGIVVRPGGEGEKRNKIQEIQTGAFRYIFNVLFF